MSAVPYAMADASLTDLFWEICPLGAMSLSGQRDGCKQLGMVRQVGVGKNGEQN